MNSSESEQSDNENFCNEFLFAKDNRYEWKQLEINGVENNIVTIFDDTLIELSEIYGNIILILISLDIFVVII